ncbi:EAL domain-containing protein [Sporosarcina sp. Sa2YVA2]|uniref:EAL domain-containing protein n=1 Tax=Sporosarcina quadrami TaxID=2762234 RepID=A0ABR8UBD5_9BACL|nr:EAL domain-containing protein [Sporosarcina quadrami]MBD7985344.1 EAL domain-containing protein [Sporosarcina quadrami]
MNKSLSVQKRLWLFFFAIIIIPNALEEVITRLFSLHFTNVMWYEVLDTVIMLFFSVPVFLYLIKQSDRYAGELEYQLIENEKIIEEIEMKNKELIYAANTDHLTQLPNRPNLFYALDHHVLTGLSEKVGILFIDLDRFKIINDTMGHLYGDLFLKEVADRLKSHLPAAHQLFRHGGDEFIIVVPDSDEEECEKFAKAILVLFETPFAFKGEELFTTVSIGISVFPDHGKNAETLLKHADKAMYCAKAHGGNTSCLYSLLDGESDVRQMKLENGLRTSIENEQLQIVYQPIINLQTTRVAGLEALLRWEHHELGNISPAEFIPIAEKNGMIITIGKWVLETACRQLGEWQSDGFSELCMAVNVSTRQIYEKGFSESVKVILEETGVNPSKLTLEITESLMQDHNFSTHVFKELKEIGVQLSIDDFGTGYSSLSVLSSSQIDRLKIDQSFTQGMLGDGKTQSIVKTIIDMGANLDLELIAEGIETQEQEETLRQFGCQYGQGYYISRPLSAEKVDMYLFAKSR